MPSHSSPAASTARPNEAGGGWGVPLAVVETKSFEAHVVPQPFQPIREVFAHKLLRVVNVRGALKLVAATGVTLQSTHV